MTRKLLSSVAFVSIMFTAGTAESSVAPQALTLERLKAQSVSFLEDSSNADIAVHELKTTAAAGDVSVRIDGKTYYFTPVYAENASALQTLADIGSVALKKLTDSTGAIYSLKIDGETVYYGYDKDALPTSGYTLSKISQSEAENASFPVVTRYTKNDDNTLTETYYKVNIPEAKFDNFASHDTIKWKEISESEKDDKIENSGVISFVLPGDEVKYFRYSYNPADYDNDKNNRKLYTERQTSLSGDIDADFIESKIKTSSHADGGAIYNYYYYSTIGNITGDFIGNSAQSTSYPAYGGAIYNNNRIGNITGNFIGNYVQSTGSYSLASGGAIYNNENYNAVVTIGDIIGDFIGNYAQGSSSAYGGAIYNAGKIGNITGDFIGNYAQSTSEHALGGAIYNYGSNSVTIGDITGDFINNYAQATSSNAYGGAISNTGKIGNITGNFIGNYTKATSDSACGGAIYNAAYYATIGNISGDFIGNYVQSTGSYSRASGGAIYNNNRIGNITGDFIGNYAQASYYEEKGGAIYSWNGTIGDIIGDFIGNYAQGSSSAYGGAIYSNSTIGNIIGDFIGNYAKSTGTSSSDSASGGAIYNYAGSDSTATATIGNITGDFIGNYAQASSGSASGGAIANDGNNSATIGDITGDFINNYAQGTYALGGAIYSWNGTIGDIIGDFIGNYAQGSSSAYGGAIYSNSTIGNIIGDFIGNYAKSTGTSSSDSASGGAIANDGSYTMIGNITGDFIGNYAQASSGSASGGAIYNKYSTIGNISGNFIGNYAQATGTSSYSKAYGGAIYNNGTISNIVNSSFTDNYAQTASGTAQGGAIWSNRDILITADNGTSLFDGNYVSNDGGTTKKYEAVYMNGSSTLTLNAVNNGTIRFDDYINGVSGYKTVLKGDTTGTIKLWDKADILNSNVSTSGGVTIDTADGKLHNYQFRSLNSDAASSYKLDIDLANTVANTTYGVGEKADGITTAYASSGTVTLSALNFVNGNLDDIFNNSLVIQIIKNKNASSSLQLALGSELSSLETEEGVLSSVVGRQAVDLTPVVKYSDKFGVETTTENIYGKLGLVRTDSDNDSIGISITRKDTETTFSPAGDTLALLNQSDQFAGVDRIFKLYDEDETDVKSVATYVVSEDLGATSGGVLKIEGTSDGDVKSKLEFDGHSGFELSHSGTELTLSDLQISGSSETVINGVSSDGSIILTNVNLQDNGAEKLIMSRGNVSLEAAAGSSIISGNSGTAIFMNGEADNKALLSMNTRNDGVVRLDDEIDGLNYDVVIDGDGTGSVDINNTLKGISDFQIGSGGTAHIGLDGKIYAENMSVYNGGVVGQQPSGSPTIKLDVEVDVAANQINTGKIYVTNDVMGNYSVIVNALNEDVLSDSESAKVAFMYAPNDDMETPSSFSIARIIGNPYMWENLIDTSVGGSTWYLNLPQPAADTREVAPEVIAGAGLHEAAIEQTRSVVRNVRNKVAAGRVYCPGCGLYDYNWNGNKLRNGWVLAQGETATIDKPVKMDADIWGVEAGFDVQNDVNNTLGVFASYRKGEYDLNGKADKLRSTIGSEIDIDSYLAGLYYRYDKNMNWLFATVYGGVQQADAKTDDKIAKFDTDGIEFGASVEAGHTFALSNDLTLDPSLGLYYTQVNFDDAKDNLGKEYSWKDVKHLEAELGAKLEKQIDAAKVYVKPSVIQTVTSGDSVKITGLNKLSTYDDQTLGRIELGGRYGFTDALSAYGWVNYTFGSDYDATAFGAGVSYSW